MHILLENNPSINWIVPYALEDFTKKRSFSFLKLNALLQFEDCLRDSRFLVDLFHVKSSLIFSLVKCFLLDCVDIQTLPKFDTLCGIFTQLIVVNNIQYINLSRLKNMFLLEHLWVK